MDLIDSELLMKSEGGGYSGSIEIKRVGVSDRLTDLIFALIDFLLSLDYFAFIRLLGR